MWLSIDIAIAIAIGNFARHVQLVTVRDVQPIVRVRVRHVVDLPLKDECRHCIC